MSDSEGDFESADEEAGVAPNEHLQADEDATAIAAPVVINQPPTAAQADAASPTVEVSYGSGGGGWTSWGMSWGQSLISGAKSGVSVIAKELGDGIGTVSRTVESVLEAPSPEEMAGGVGAASGQQDSSANPPAAEAAASTAPSVATGPTSAVDNDGSGSGWLQSSWRVGGALTSSVSQTGSYLVSGGLDLLEALGKRTMDALQETDPGFQRTKVLLGRGRRPNLSELLREAQASGAAAASAADSGAEGSSADADINSPDFACQFDRLNGSAYLDGLQTLASQCELRLQAKLSTRPTMRPIMAEILARLERVRSDAGDDDEAAGEAAAVKPATLGAALAGLPAQFAPANAWLSNAVSNDCLQQHGDDKAEELKGQDVAALQVDCVRRLAALTAVTIHYLLKAASLASAAAADTAASADSASALAGLCLALIGCADAVRELACSRIQTVANASAAIDEHAVNQAMTQVILEAEGAKAYLQDAFLLLAPVLQLAALEEPVASSPATASSGQ